MSTKMKLFSASLILAASLMTAGIAQAAGKQIGQDEELATNTSQIGGQLNQCWGDIASQLAKLDMGAHTRSTKGANQVGGFAADGTDANEILGIEFNVKDDSGSAGRAGVGPTSMGFASPHDGHPGDSGNGLHAITNGQLAANIDPVTGMFTDGEPLVCDLKGQD